MTIATTSISHIRLTVTDIERSRAFYERVFAWPVFVETPNDADAADADRYAYLYGGVLYLAGNFLVGLRPVASDTFDENRVGLDHLSLSVVDLDALHAAASTLDDLGIAHEPVKAIEHGSILEFRDPDGIALELFAPNT